MVVVVLLVAANGRVAPVVLNSNHAARYASMPPCRTPAATAAFANESLGVSMHVDDRIHGR